MRSIIALSGFMGTGKSTLGPLLAIRLGIPLVETDDAVARRAGMPVPDLWRTRGEAAFRGLESEVVTAILETTTPKVVAFGGGTVTARSTRHLALDRATVVTLVASPETILARVGDTRLRPALHCADPLGRIRSLLDQRRDAYAECHLTVATDVVPVEEAVARIIALFGQRRVVVPLGLRSYPVDVVDDAPHALTASLNSLAPSSLIVVSDENVRAARGGALARSLAQVPIPPGLITDVTLPAGEPEKNLGAVQRVWDAALAARVDRHAVVVGFGGGVVGDLAGFAASTLLRGLRSVLVPTSLLAMVDASVGGKTGFDHPRGKNLIGSFHQPSSVVVDLAHLSTLPRRELVAGLAEVVKVAVAFDEALFVQLESSAKELGSGDTSALASVVQASIRQKAMVVRDDEIESGHRKVLNLGHTLGHALEAATGYSRFVHGEAVAIGLVLELVATERLGFTAPGVAGRVRALLQRLGLLTEVPSSDLRASWEYVRSDKKRLLTTLELPVVRSVGTASVEVVSLRDFAHSADLPLGEV